jgi:hypothetical protein
VCHFVLDGARPSDGKLQKTEQNQQAKENKKRKQETKNKKLAN